MSKRAKYPKEVPIRIPKDITELYEKPVLEILLTKREAEFGEKIIKHIKKNGRLWPDEWKELTNPNNPADVKAYYNALRKLISLGLLTRGKENSIILSDEFIRKLTVLIDKVSALIR